MTPKRVPFRLLTVCALAAVACASPEAPPTAEFRLMDAPPDGVSSVRVYVAAIQAHVAPGSVEDDDQADKSAKPKEVAERADAWVTLPVGREIDLVKHQGEMKATVLGELTLPEGKITQIRLILDTTRPHTATVLDYDCALDVSKVPPTGIKINHPFKAFSSAPGDRHTIWVDVELDQSLKSDGQGCYRLEPQVRLHRVRNILTDVAI